MSMRSLGDEGYSLGNVITTLVICIVLACMMLPALQPNRTGWGRRSDCLSNMRNVGVAMHNYNAAHGRLPPSGVWDVTDPSTYAEWSDLGNIASNPKHKATMRYSWALMLMPFLDHSDIYDQWDFDESKTPAQPIGADAKGKSGFGSYWMTSTAKSLNGGNAKLADTNIKVLTCPADPTTTLGQGNLSYIVNGGFSYHWRMDYTATGGDGKGALIDLSNEQSRRWSDNVRNSGVFFLESSKAYADACKPPLKTDDVRSLSLEEIADGPSTTVMMTENINSGPGALWETDNLKSNWACPHPWNTSFFVNGVLPTLAKSSDPFRFKAANTRGKEVPPLKPFGSQGGINGDLSGEFEGQFPYPNSGHAKIVHVLMCDGSAKPISQDIDSEIWAALVTPNGRKFMRPGDGAVLHVEREWQDSHW